MLHGSKRVLLFDDAGYLARMKTLFGSSLIGYWPGGEPNGAVALDYSGLGFHGAYTGVTLGQQGAGDGLTCPLYDGSTSYMQPPAGFRAALNGQLGSVLFWVAPDGWTVSGNVFQFFADASNLIRASQNSIGATDRFELNYIAGGTTKAVSESGGQTYTTFRHFGMTWDLSADQFIVYKSGAQLGSIQTGLGTFAGTFLATQTLIGAGITTPASVLSGRIAHLATLNRVATPAEVAAASVI